MTSFNPPEPLADAHVLTEFQCRSSEQTAWLLRHARQAIRIGTTKVFVVAEQGSTRVVAYYAWCIASVKHDKTPGRFQKGSGRYPQPVALLARLGVDIRYEGAGLGVGLLQDVFLRLCELSETIGCRGLLVHAESESAQQFYLHLVPDFEPSPTDDMHLFMLMKDIRMTCRALGLGR